MRKCTEGGIINTLTFHKTENEWVANNIRGVIGKDGKLLRVKCEFG